MGFEKNKILIIEPSDIIRQGLLFILAGKNNNPYQVNQCTKESDVEPAIQKAKAEVLIISPSIFKQNEKKITRLKEANQMLIVGLVYTFQHPDELGKFDALIYINDPIDKIRTAIHELLQSHTPANNSSQTEELTGREKEILKLLVSGNTTKQIASSLFISAHTVNAHRKNIMRKLDIKTVSGLTIYAVLNNIISLKEA